MSGAVDETGALRVVQRKEKTWMGTLHRNPIPRLAIYLQSGIIPCHDKHSDGHDWHSWEKGEYCRDC
eukprot:1138862-Pelagomonas_calceolata.AAC.4